MVGSVLSGLSTAVSYIPSPFKSNAVVEGVKAVNENVGNLLAGAIDIANSESTDPGVVNPFFTQNGFDGPSPNTASYFRFKKWGGGAMTLAVSVGDVGGLSSAYQTGSYSLVWYKLNALFQKMIPPSRRAKPVVYAHWYSYEVAKKAVPAGSLETRMTAIMRQKMYGAVGGATKTGITFGTGGFTGYFVNSASSWLAPTLEKLFGQDVQHLAQGLHWFAYRELAISHGQGKGPAMRILEILWSDLAIGKSSGVTLEQIVREPCGWLVIADFIN
jgi:hypothetical protein